MRSWAALLLVTLLAACSTVPTRTLGETGTEALFNDQLFAVSKDRVSADDVFALSPEMKSYLKTDIANELRIKGSQQALFDALYRKGGLKLDYESKTTQTAAQAFVSRSGNCLSLVILTGAFAKELGLNVRYQKIYVDAAWSRENELDFFEEHVNVTLGIKYKTGTRAKGVNAHEMTVDFLPPEQLKDKPVREISERTIIAMYLNNRAAEWLAMRQLDKAYWWARAAIVQDPRYVPAYNTLGVIYNWHENPGDAERVFRHILAAEPENTVALSNLVLVLNAVGRRAEAAVVSAKLKEIRPYPPFYFLDQGVAAMKQKQYLTAKAMFTKEIERNAYYDRSHFWLAVAYYELGDMRNARRQLTIAMETSTSASDRERYAEKLAGLRAGRMP